MKEIKTLKGYEHVKEGYYIDKDGKVYSFRNKLGGLNDSPKERKQSIKTGGYKNVGLVVEGNKVKWFRVHRLVASAFCENKGDKPYVNHIDNTRTNNHFSNLEWVTPKENNLHSMSKKTYCYLFDGSLEKIYEYMGAAVADGYNRGHVGSCASGNIRQHKQRVFSYTPLTVEDVVQRLSKPYYQNGTRK